MAAAIEAVTPEAVPANTVTYGLVADGTEARYRVREQLLGRPLPSEAVGRTRSVTGSIVLEPTGRILAPASKFVVDLRTLRSDEGRRDSYIQRSTLQTQRFPFAEFVPRDTAGTLEWALPSKEEMFELTGDLTVRGVTRPTTWLVSLRPASPDLTGTASTSFALTDFGMIPPRVGPVLSIEDRVTLELDFQFRLRAG